MAKKLTHDTNDKDFIKKLSGFYDYEFQTNVRRVNEDFEDDFYEKQLEKYERTYVDPVDPDKIENDRLIDETLKKISSIKRNLI